MAGNINDLSARDSITAPRARMQILLLVIASAAYSVGGLFMKYSEGMSRLTPTITFLLLFLAGAGIQAIAMRRSDLGMAYIFVLGVEAAMTAVLSVFMLRETWSVLRVTAVVLILAGILMLRRT